MSYVLTYEGQEFCIRHSGHVTFDEIAEANDRLIEHEAWGSHLYQIWSYLDATAVEGEKRDGRVISKVDQMSHRKSRAKPIKVAFVSTNARTNEIIGAYIDSVDGTQFDAAGFTFQVQHRGYRGTPRRVF